MDEETLVELANKYETLFGGPPPLLAMEDRDTWEPLIREAIRTEIPIAPEPAERGVVL